MQKNPMEQNIKIPILLSCFYFAEVQTLDRQHIKTKRNCLFCAINFLTIVLVSYKEKHNKMENRVIMYD